MLDESDYWEVCFTMDEWNWWKTGKGSSYIPRPWQVLSEEDKKKVIVIPMVRRGEHKKAKPVEVVKDAPEMPAKDADIVDAQVGEQPKKRRCGGREAIFKREDVLRILAEMTEFYGEIPSITQIVNYRLEHKGIPSVGVFTNNLGAKYTWRQQLDEYLEKH